MMTPDMLAKHRDRFQKSAGKDGIPVVSGVTMLNVGSLCDPIKPALYWIKEPYHDERERESGDVRGKVNILTTIDLRGIRCELKRRRQE
jgi:hypothetical protein